MTDAPRAGLPPLADLGLDLLRITPARRAVTLAVPFACVAGYAALAHLRHWLPAVACLVYLSFATYGSISHDLVHRTLGLPRRVNDVFLTVIELLAFRAGHAYRLVHLHHHARFPHDDDVEGAAAKMSLGRTLVEGVIFQPKIMCWAVAKHGRTHRLVLVETAAAVTLLASCFAAWPWTPAPAVYAVLMVMGSWAIPLATSYLPHNADGRTALTQTRLFRGRVASIVALEHLYHLEHHLYPSVPHHNWPKLARRLDPYFRAAGVEPIVLGF
jgi:beta-carotene hydroxylase